MPSANSPVVILVRPQMGENIGAVARAMSNFGLRELRLVAPRDGWPNPKATEMAAGAEAIINSAQTYPDFSSALADIQIMYATTARRRDMEKPIVTPDVACVEMKQHITSGIKVALVFGPERTGLENDEVMRAHTLITIPTAPENSSLNIAQSMVILGYEWFKTTAPEIAQAITPPAPYAEMEGLFGQLESYLDEVNYFRIPDKKPTMWQNLQTMLLRGQFNSQEVRTLRGMLRSIWEKRTDR